MSSNPQTYCYNTVYLPNQNVIDKNIINLGSCVLENPGSPTGCYTNFVNDISLLPSDSNFNNIANLYQLCIANNQPTTAPTTTPSTSPSGSNNTGLIVGVVLIIFFVILPILYFLSRKYFCNKDLHSTYGAKADKIKKFFKC